MVSSYVRLSTQELKCLRILVEFRSQGTKRVPFIATLSVPPASSCDRQFKTKVFQPFKYDT